MAISVGLTGGVHSPTRHTIGELENEQQAAAHQPQAAEPFSQPSLSSNQVRTAASHPSFRAQHVQTLKESNKLGPSTQSATQTEETEISEATKAHEASIMNAFFDAARKGDITKLKSLMAENKIDINVRDKEGKTILVNAAIRNKGNVMQLSIDQGVDI